MQHPDSQKAYADKLLDSFFVKEDQKLIERLHNLRKLKQTEEELSNVSGIKNPEILKKLVELNVRPEALVSLSLVPLVLVAWADGAIDKVEENAVLAELEQLGITKDNIDYKLVSQWLTRKPEPALLTAWTFYMQGLCELMSSEEKKTFKRLFISRARSIALASGGFLGIGKMSEAEALTLELLEAAFDDNTGRK